VAGQNKVRKLKAAGAPHPDPIRNAIPTHASRFDQQSIAFNNKPFEILAGSATRRLNKIQKSFISSRGGIHSCNCLLQTSNAEGVVANRWLSFMARGRMGFADIICSRISSLKPRRSSPVWKWRCQRFRKFSSIRREATHPLDGEILLGFRKPFSEPSVLAENLIALYVTTPPYNHAAIMDLHRLRVGQNNPRLLLKPTRITYNAFVTALARNCFFFQARCCGTCSLIPSRVNAAVFDEATGLPTTKLFFLALGELLHSRSTLRKPSF